MKTRPARLTLRYIMLCMILIAAAASTANASTHNYVSWKGGFYISYPEAWQQVDYGLADTFLKINQAGETILDYDVVISDTLSKAFFDGEYFVLTVDTVGLLTETEVDSVLGDLFSTFHSKLSYFPVANLLANLEANAPSYDSDQKVASVINKIEITGGTYKRSLLMMKFYEKGIATFYYYAPDSLFDQGMKIMQQVVMSLSTEDIDAAAASQDQVKVTDATIPEPEEYEPSSSRSKNGKGIPVAVAIAILIVMIAVIRRKRKKRS